MCKHDHQWHYFSEIELIDKKFWSVPIFLTKINCEKIAASQLKMRN